MRMIDPMIMEFDRESATTRKVLANVPGDKLAWKPHEKSMSLGQLAQHLATLPGWIGATILQDGFDFGSGMGDMGKEPESTEGILATFDASTATAKGAMSRLDDGAAMGAWTLRNGEKVFMEMPRIAVVRSVLLNHSFHHRGQLSVYLRLLDVKVPAVYGPSADDNPFA